jgi:DNA-binding MarR family transcriptional regulator
MTKKPTVKMQKSVLEDLGVSRHAFYRARDKMEEAGLISVEKKPGQTHLITLLVAGKDPQPNRRPSELKLLARNTGMKRTIN